MKQSRNEKMKYTKNMLVLVLVLFAVATFVIAKENSTTGPEIAEATGTEQIDALVKSILEGAADSEQQKVEEEKAAAVKKAVKTPKRAIVMDDNEILQAVEIVGDISQGSVIKAITFNKDMTIADALRFLALKYQKNIIPSANVDGMITVTNLYNVTFEQTLEAIIGPNKAEIDGQFIRIYTPDEYKEDLTRMVHEVIKLNYITAAEAENLIKPVLTDTGAVAATTPAMLDTEPGSGGDTLATQDRIVINDYPEVIAKAKEIIASIDVPPAQILIEVTILEATLNETTKFGVDWNLLGVDMAGTLGNEGFNQTGFANTTSGLSIGIVQDKIEVLIEALETITDTTVLANPKILALNKQAGKLLIGDEKGYKTTTTSNGVVSENVEFLESGTLLEFRPFICADGMIRMEIHPEQSEGTINAQLLPDKTTTTVQTNIMVKDGKTIVLGGLFKEKTVLTRSQVPVLGDIPIIGGAFKGTNDQSIRTELIVLITPHVIADPEQTDGADRLDDVRRINDDARRNLTWMSRVRIAEDRYKKAVELYQDGNMDAAMSQLNVITKTERIYHEAERLKERIIKESQPANVDRIERIMLDNIEKDDTEKWKRR